MTNLEAFIEFMQENNKAIEKAFKESIQALQLAFNKWNKERRNEDTCD